MKKIHLTIFSFALLALPFGCGEQSIQKDLRNASLIKGSDAESNRRQDASSVEKNADGQTGGSINNPSVDDQTESPQVDLTVDTIEKGALWLESSKTAKRSFKETQMQTWIPPNTAVDLEKAIADAAKVTTTRTNTFQIKHWYDHSTGACKFHVVLENDEGKTYGAKDLGCLDQNEFGMQKCDELEKVFLGTKDIGTFKGAWGVRLTCKGKFKSTDVALSELKGTNYLSIRETWYHPESHHYHRKVQEARLSFMDLGSKTINAQVNSAAPVTVYLHTFENTEPKGSVDKTLIPPLMVGSYSLAGSVKFPGRYSSRTKCRESMYDRTKLGTIAIGRLFIDEERNGTPGIKRMAGIWTPNFEESPQPGGGGAVVGGLFSNQDWSDSYFDTGTYNINIQKVANSDYFKIRVTRSNAITLMISRFSSSVRKYAYVNQIDDIYCIMGSEAETSKLDAWQTLEY